VLVTQAKELIAQVARAQFSSGDMALEIEPMRSVGGSMPNGTDDLFTVTEPHSSPGRFPPSRELVQDLPMPHSRSMTERSGMHLTSPRGQGA
jgi:hypothetical protein